MKRTTALIMVAASMLTASAQSIYYQDAANVDMARHTLHREILRQEFVLPEVNGFKVYKADLHSHSIYSDGNVTPEYRVREAWVDGLDVLAITEHVEYRPTEGKMLSFLKGYHPAGTKTANTSITGRAADKRGIMVDLNLPIELARKAAVGYGITIIPGIEITRIPETIGHYNALFIEDANNIYAADPTASIKKAREQGALIMHNHPGWRRENLKMTEFEQSVYGENLIDGVEIMNGTEFYPSAVKRALDNKLFMASNTDIHSTTAMEYTNQGHHRNMTFILAKDASLNSLKDALKKRRTLAYSFGSLAGDEELIKDFFHACVKFETYRVDEKGKSYIRMTNNTSMDFVLNFGGNPVQLRAFTSRNASVNKGKELTFTVENMWIPTEQKHPEFKIKFK